MSKRCYAVMNGKKPDSQPPAPFQRQLVGHYEPGQHGIYVVLSFSSSEVRNEAHKVADEFDVGLWNVQRKWLRASEVSRAPKIHKIADFNWQLRILYGKSGKVWKIAKLMQDLELEIMHADYLTYHTSCYHIGKNEKVHYRESLTQAEKREIDRLLEGDDNECQDNP